MSIAYEMKGPVGWLTLSRPKAMNALNREMVDGMRAQLAAWKDDAAVRTVVIPGTGAAFCAGADLKQVSAPTQPGDKDFLDAIVVFFNILRDYPNPGIAPVS